MGACPRCDGLGQINYFDPKRVVAHPELSLAAGAIRGWDHRNQFYFQMLKGLAEHYGFELDTPYENLPAETQAVVLDGSGEEKIRFIYLNEKGNKVVREHAFEGIIPNLDRRHKETDSVAVREELAKYLNTQSCPECKGTRLRREARSVRVGGRTIYEVSALALRKTTEFFATLALSGARLAIAVASATRSSPNTFARCGSSHSG